MKVSLSYFTEKYGSAKVRFCYFAKNTIHFHGIGDDGERLNITIDLLDRGRSV